MVDAVRTAEKAIGEVFYGFSKTEKESRIFRRSLFAVKNISAGEKIAVNDIRSIRPGHGLHTRYLDKVVGRRAKKDIKKGTPISWDLI
jgi:sialic acid synthase SpsE